MRDVLNCVGSHQKSAPVTPALRFSNARAWSSVAPPRFTTHLSFTVNLFLLIIFRSLEGIVRLKMIAIIGSAVVVEAIELAIALVPIIGNIVAAYEALFGYKLTDLERGILAASVLLPLAGRLAKAGRAIYTESRLVALYGRDASAWSRAIQASSRAARNGRAVRTIEEAEEIFRAQKFIDQTLAQNTAKAIPEIVHGPVATAGTVDEAIASLFRELSSQFKAIGSLDELAMRRILEKGPNVDHIKGQLLEELIESRIVPWLRDRAGSFALGIQTSAKKIEFIPGHLIRDELGRQITDGILAIRNNGILEIVAVFEAKAGRRAARELSLAKGSISSLTTAERSELRAYAKDVLLEQRAAAQEAGLPFKKTVSDVEEEIALSESGGQVRRDIERLTEDANGKLPKIRIGSDLVPVQLSPKKAKFFGVFPNDVDPSIMQRELTDAGFSFEIIGADIKARELKSVADSLKPLAEKLAAE